MLSWCVSLVFFFECYGEHRGLHVLTHAFPTRRSSDLAPWAGPEARARPEAIRTQTCKARKNRRSRAGADWQRSSKECATLRPAVERSCRSCLGPNRPSSGPGSPSLWDNLCRAWSDVVEPDKIGRAHV